MDELHQLVQECKDLGVQALITNDPVDVAKYERASWQLWYNHAMQILDILDDALQAHKEGKL